MSDHLLQSYFQEYHPLFPVLHRPTFLASYEKLVSGDGSQVNTLPHHSVAQLFLVFAIAQQSEVGSRTSLALSKKRKKRCSNINLSREMDLISNLMLNGRSLLMPLLWIALLRHFSVLFSPSYTAFLRAIIQGFYSIRALLLELH